MESTRVDDQSSYQKDSRTLVAFASLDLKRDLLCRITACTPTQVQPQTISIAQLMRDSA
jgi:hypothetical protein